MASSLFPNECKAYGLKCKNKSLGPRKLSLRVMQNIYSPNRLYLTFPHDNY